MAKHKQHQHATVLHSFTPAPPAAAAALFLFRRATPSAPSAPCLLSVSNKRVAMTPTQSPWHRSFPCISQALKPIWCSTKCLARVQQWSSIFPHASADVRELFGDLLQWCSNTIALSAPAHRWCQCCTPSARCSSESMDFNFEPNREPESDVKSAQRRLGTASTRSDIESLPATSPR
ncbi:hypothetical protein U9M48_008579 [Paspalum notatum var. saurae]|uniref:Uncharacterized protein n=1 Tax=Paspalum notatum var. saurae TaxID=547442 RepID=A0AAQ3WDN6_PASNO